MSILSEKTPSYLTLEKADRHLHLEGCVGLELLTELAERNAIPLDAPISLGKNTQVPAPILTSGFRLEHGFQDFIQIYLKISECLLSTEDILDVGDAYLQSAKGQNISLSEIYFSPTTHLTLGKKLEPLFDGLKELQKRAPGYGTQVRWIFDVVRNSKAAPNSIIDVALSARKSGVDVHAIGLAGLELGHPAENFIDVFERARAESFLTLAHAGETDGPESVRNTIRFLKPDRIGHGVQALQDTSLLEELAEKKIPIEVCPWSNILLNVLPDSLINQNEEPPHHPIAQMIDAGLEVILCSDDPGIFSKTLNENYQLAEASGVSEAMLDEVRKRSLKV